MSATTYVTSNTTFIIHRVRYMLHILPHVRYFHAHSIHLLGEVTHVELGPLDKVKLSLYDLINGDLISSYCL